MNKQFKILDSSTKHRVKSPKNYLIAINPQNHSLLGLGKYAVVTRTLIKNTDKKEIILRTYCRIIIDENAPDDIVYSDQSIRDALAIPFNYDKEQTFIELHPLYISFPQKLTMAFSRILDRRYAYFRVFSGVVFDIEKNIARSDELSFDILGIQPGGKVVLEGVSYDQTISSYRLYTHSATLFQLPCSWEPKQKNLEAFDIKRDLLPVTLDAHMRESVECDLLNCVCARRNVLQLFIEEFRVTGIISLLTLFTILSILPVDLKSWFSIIPNSLIILVITIVLMIINIRASLK